MTANPHERARQLIAISGVNDASDGEQAWLRGHLQECTGCREYQEEAGHAIRALRSMPLAADGSLVRTTQIRVQARARELRRERERMWVVSICCTAVTTAVLWHGFAWIGEQARIPSTAWQIALVEFCLVPTLVAGIFLLARGTHLANTSGSLQD